MTRAVLVLTSDHVREKACAWVRSAPPGTRVEYKAPKRSLPQNDLLWSRLTEIAKQVEWYGEKLTADEWKTVFTAALRKSRVVPGIDGGFVVLGLSTSSMTKTEFTDLLELIGAFAGSQGVELAA